MMTGNLDAQSIQLVESELLPYLETTEIKLLLEASQLHFMLDAGLKMLLHVAHIIDEHQGKAAICCLAEPIMTQISKSEQSNLLPIFTTCQEGLAYLQAS
jgi:anti-anti-sigma factor